MLPDCADFRQIGGTGPFLAKKFLQVTDAENGANLPGSSCGFCAEFDKMHIFIFGLLLHHSIIHMNIRSLPNSHSTHIFFLFAVGNHLQ